MKMKNKFQKFWVPWHPAEGYLGAYCHDTKNQVIQDMEENFWIGHSGEIIGAFEKYLKKDGWKIIPVTFQPIKMKK